MTTVPYLDRLAEDLADAHPTGSPRHRPHGVAAGAVAFAVTVAAIVGVVAIRDEAAGPVAAGACPVTVPTGDFEAPDDDGVPRQVADGFAWHGTAALWTALPTEPTEREAGVPWRKSVWWSDRFPGGSVEEQPDITVTYERLDADVEPVVTGSPGTNAYTRDDGWFMIAGLDPDPAGCWRATATYKGATLSFVYLVR